MKKVMISLWVLLTLGLGVASGYFYMQNFQLSAKVRELQNDPKVIAQKEVESTVAVVAKLVDLPQGEDPVVATVTDKEKLKDQNFFAKAENGDKVLIYGKAKKIYLYSVAQNRLLEAAPLNIGQTPTASTAPSTAPAGN